MRHVPAEHPDAALACPLAEALPAGGAALATRLVAELRSALGERALDADTDLALRAAVARALHEGGL